jgi:hypothetical protein
MPPDGPGPSASSSGLDFQLHPVRDLRRPRPPPAASRPRPASVPPLAVVPAAQLVLINISDHHTRSKANAAPGAPPIRVAGCLLGQQAGRTVDISNSFEVNIVPGEPALLDAAFLAKKLDQCEPPRPAPRCPPPPAPPARQPRATRLAPPFRRADKQTFPALDLVGWYSTGAAPSPDDLASHRQLLALNDAPVFLQLDPAPPPAATRDLPVALYESGAPAAWPCTLRRALCVAGMSFAVPALSEQGCSCCMSCAARLPILRCRDARRRRRCRRRRGPVRRRRRRLAHLHPLSLRDRHLGGGAHRGGPGLQDAARRLRRGRRPA